MRVVDLGGCGLVDVGGAWEEMVFDRVVETTWGFAPERAHVCQVMHLLGAFNDPVFCELEERKTPSVRGTRLIELLPPLSADSRDAWSPLLKALLGEGKPSESPYLRPQVEFAWIRVQAHRPFALPSPAPCAPPRCGVRSAFSHPSCGARRRRVLTARWTSLSSSTGRSCRSG